jgi:hypothetical protein
MLFGKFLQYLVRESMIYMGDVYELTFKRIVTNYCLICALMRLLVYYELAAFWFEFDTMPRRFDSSQIR